jgi:hypothetical protein
VLIKTKNGNGILLNNNDYDTEAGIAVCRICALRGPLDQNEDDNTTTTIIIISSTVEKPRTPAEELIQIFQRILSHIEKHGESAHLDDK